MADLVEQINEARKVVEELGGKRTKSLDDLKGELDRMIEASKQPGYSANDAETLIKKRELVVSAMETALHVLVNETLDDTAATAETPTETTPRAPETPTQSAFTTPSETPKTTSNTQESAIGTHLQRFMSGAGSMASNGYEGFKGLMSSAGKNISGFFAYLGTSITTLWNSWFGKKDATTNTPAQPPAVTTTGTANPEVQRAYDENPGSESPATNEPPLIPLPGENAPRPAPDQPPEPDPLTADTQPESVSLMDGKVHEIGGRDIVWNGTMDNLLSIDGKVFGVTIATMGQIIAGNPTLEKRGDTLVIRTRIGVIELTKDQIASAMQQALSGQRKTVPARFLSAEYDYVSVNLEYSTTLGDGAAATRTPGSKVIELLPK